MSAAAGAGRVLLIEDDPIEARAIAETLDAGNRRRQEVEADVLTRAVEAAQRQADQGHPVLLVTGDKDLVPGFVGDPRDHLYPVETAPSGKKYAVVLAGGDHNLIGGQPEALYRRARDLGTAFLEAEVLELKKGMETVEERARHELGMVKEGETLYQLAE